MTERWGFDLDMTAVRLMRRDGETWREIAVERIDGPDIEDRLMALVDRIAPDQPVDIFLPRDQILYTDVEIGSDETAVDDIEAAMEGRTPYRLEELQIDWIKTSETVARVAAIAIDTLDEAAAFADARGLVVRSYSSLARAEDFPHLPDFGGDFAAFENAPDDDDVTPAPVEGAADVPSVGQDTLPDAPEHTLYADDGPVSEEGLADGAQVEDDLQAEEEMPTFASARTSSYPPVTDTDLASGPVIRVEDKTPVMQVRSKPVAPLDPGQPLTVQPSTPRIRTDIAASSVSGHAASLTPGAPISPRREPSAPARTAVVFALAAALTIGIAVIVWQLLPMRPGQTPVEPAETTGELLTEIPDTTTVAALPPETGTSPEAVDDAEITEVAPALPDELDADVAETAPAFGEEQDVAEAIDLPVPEVATRIVPMGDGPEAGEAATLVEVTNITPVAMPNLPRAARPAAADRPAVIPVSPSRTPEGLIALERTAPLVRMPFAGADEAASADVTVARTEAVPVSLETSALPATEVFAALSLPDVGSAPAPALAVTEEATAAAETVDDSIEAPVVAALTDEITITPPVERIETAPSVAEGVDEAAPLESDVALADPDPAPEASPQIEYVQTDLARSLPDRTPRARPVAITELAEQQKFGGLTREQLAERRPPARPQSAQAVAEAEQDTTPSEFAVATSVKPKSRPAGFQSTVTATLSQQEAARITASLDFETPDTSDAVAAALATEVEPQPRPEGTRPQDTPRLAIPSDASVARQATIEDAIRLNRLNLVGVYGVPSDRRALVRLPSGRYIKVKVGDRVDGGTVAQIKDSELIYRKGGRNIALTMPRG